MSTTLVGLRRKISSADDLRAVVRTMKAVAASNIGQYEKSVSALKEYSRAVEMGLGVCFRADKSPRPPGGSAKSRAPAPVAAIVFGSDQGLVGQFNETIVDFALKTLAASPGVHDVWAVGEHAQAHLVDAGLTPLEVFAVPSSVDTITPLIAEILVASEKRQGVDQFKELHLFYNRPTSGSAYEAVDQQLLPFDEKWRKNLADQPWPTASLPDILGDQAATLHALIREYLFISLYRACAESLASENASRLAAMQRADKNIAGLLDDLNSNFHRLRQSGIDEELFDVIAGFEALSHEVSPQ